MFIENPVQYPALRGLFSGLRHHLAVEAVLTGEVQAGILVDDPRQPRIGLMRLRQRCYVAGDAADAGTVDTLRAWLVEETIPRMKAEGYEVTGVNFSPVTWEQQIEAFFTPERVKAVQRQHYLLDLRAAKALALGLPPGFALRLADKALLEDARLQDLDDLREEMCSERASVAEFLQKSFGIVALHGQTLAGWCLSEYNCGERCEVGIGTQEPYRRQGIASAMGAAFLREAHRRGIWQVGWDCFASNQPSVATALRLGFEKTTDYPACLVWF